MGWHIVITEEMMSLGLRGNELLIYALIYGYSQGEQGCYWGSLATICERCGIKSKATTMTVLKSLLKKGYITKKTDAIAGVKVCYYMASKNCYTVSKNDMGVYQNLAMNIKDDIKYNSMYKRDPFCFKKSLISIGVSEAVADAWIVVRKTKRATNSEIAFKRIKAEIEKSGRSADDCIRLAVEKSWQGFEAAWLEGRKQESRSKGSEASKESAFEHNMRLLQEQMIFNNANTQTDEQ